MDSEDDTRKYIEIVFETFKITLYNVCSVHRGMYSTSGGGGCTMTTSGGCHDACGGIP